MISASYIALVALTLSGGVWIVMGVFAFGLVAVIFSYFTDRGTEIRFHPWGDSRGDAPGSLGVGNVGKDRTVDVRTWTRGTSARRRRNARPARESTLPKGDPELLAQLADWRQRLASDYAALSVPPDPSRDHMLGAPDARLQLVEYADFECPSCQAASLANARLRKHLGDELVIVVRHFPTVDAHPLFAACGRSGGGCRLAAPVLGHVPTHLPEPSSTDRREPSPLRPQAGARCGAVRRRHA
jgi:hypothetical protein